VPRVVLPRVVPPRVVLPKVVLPRVVPPRVVPRVLLPAKRPKPEVDMRPLIVEPGKLDIEDRVERLDEVVEVAGLVAVTAAAIDTGLVKAVVVAGLVAAQREKS